MACVTGLYMKTQKPNVIGFSTTIPIANGSSTIWAHYARLNWEEATEKLAQSSLFERPPKDTEDLVCITHELTYHNAMEIAKGNIYWQDGTPSDTNDFEEEHDIWYEQSKEKYHLNEEYEILSFKEALK